MPEPRNTRAARLARAGLVAIRIGPRVYWVPTELARRVEEMVAAPAVSDQRANRVDVFGMKAKW